MFSCKHVYKIHSILIKKKCSGGQAQGNRLQELRHDRFKGEPSTNFHTYQPMSTSSKSTSMNRSSPVFLVIRLCIGHIGAIWALNISMSAVSHQVFIKNTLKMNPKLMTTFSKGHLLISKQIGCKKIKTYQNTSLSSHSKLLSCNLISWHWTKRQ